MTASPAINLGRQFVFWWQSYEKSFRICRHCICGTIFGSFSHDTKSSGMKSYHTCTFKYYFKQMHEAWKPVQSLIHSHIYKKYISKTLILPSMRQDTFNWLHERCMTCRMIRMLRYLVMSVQVTLLRSHRSNKPLNLTELHNLSKISLNYVKYPLDEPRRQEAHVTLIRCFIHKSNTWNVLVEMTAKVLRITK